MKDLHESELLMMVQHGEILSTNKMRPLSSMGQTGRLMGRVGIMLAVGLTALLSTLNRLEHSLITFSGIRANASSSPYRARRIHQANPRRLSILPPTLGRRGKQREWTPRRVVPMRRRRL